MNTVKDYFFVMASIEISVSLFLPLFFITSGDKVGEVGRCETKLCMYYSLLYHNGTTKTFIHTHFVGSIEN